MDKNSKVLLGLDHVEISCLGDVHTRGSTLKANNLHNFPMNCFPKRLGTPPALIGLDGETGREYRMFCLGESSQRYHPPGV
jgi:hypothetical protein